MRRIEVVIQCNREVIAHDRVVIASFVFYVVMSEVKFQNFMRNVTGILIIICFDLKILKQLRKS